MKYFLILCIACEIFLVPVCDARVIYPDEFEIIQIDNRVDDTDSDQISLLNNPNILRSKDATESPANQHQQSHKNPEIGKFYQGDIVLLDEELRRLNDSNGSSARTGLSNIHKRWPKNFYGKVVVPFTLSDKFCKFWIF